MESQQLQEAHGLTKQQADFLSEYLTNGGDGLNAARKAGYSQNGRYWRSILRKKEVTQALREHISGDLAHGAIIATDYLIKTIQDETAPRAARNDAAKTILNRAGIVEKKDHNQADKEDKPLNEMTAAELERHIGQLSQVVDSIKDSQAVDSEAHDITPTNTEKPVKTID